MSAAEKRDPVPPAAALRLLVANLTSSPLLKMTPGGPALIATLATLLEWVDSMERRWSELAAHQARSAYKVERHEERLAFLEAGVRPLPQDLAEKAARIVQHGAQLMQLEPPYSDQARPGGPRSGDIVRPEGARFGGTEP